MNVRRCLISLDELNDKRVIQEEYLPAAVRDLTGSAKTIMKLPFTGASFIREQPEKAKGMSISGYQPKLSLSVNEDREFGVVSSLGHYILKPSPERFPCLAENEHASMMAMKRLGFQVPPFGLCRFAADEFGHQELAFIIRRFDRGPDGTRTHQEQLDGAMGINDKYGKNSDGIQDVSYEQVGCFLTSNLDSSLAFKRDFYQRVIVSYLIGNNDLHLRNFGIVMPTNAKPSFAPIYDFVSVAPYQEFDSNYLALPLLRLEENGENLPSGFDGPLGQYTGADFVRFGIGIGLSQKAAIKFLNEIVEKVPMVESTYQSSFVSGRELEKIVGCIKHRTQCLSVL